MKISQIVEKDFVMTQEILKKMIFFLIFYLTRKITIHI